MYRYSWYAVQRDGSIIQRWNEDQTENIPDANNTVEFHLLPSPEYIQKGGKTFSLFLKKEQRLIFRKRRHMDSSAGGDPIEDKESVVYIVGYEEDHEFTHFSSYCALLPDGRIEFSSEYNHITRYERNLDMFPLKIYETWPN